MSFAIQPQVLHIHKSIRLEGLVPAAETVRLRGQDYISVVQPAGPMNVSGYVDPDK